MAEDTVTMVAANGNEIIVTRHDYERGHYPELSLKGEEKPKAKPKAKAKKKAVKK